MPTDLPASPSLEHLKKQARDLLRDVRRKDGKALARFKAIGLLKDGAEPKLAGAQRVIAREYGYSSWSKLKAHVEKIASQDADPAEQIKVAFHQNDFGRVGALLEKYPSLRSRINDPNLAFGATPILCAAQRNFREMIEVLLRHGADINARSQWWAGGFGILDFADADLARFLIDRGARVDAHAAAHLGMLDTLRELIATDPELVHARGGDGKTPLHCATTIEVAEFLLDHGADIDARDVDHESTPAQYMVSNRPAVARYLVRRGCATDILMAAALGDVELVRKHLSEDPQCIRVRVSEEYFPMVGGKCGGTIYQWELGWHVSAHQVAKRFGHEAIFQLLMDRTPADEKLLCACWLHDPSLVESLLKDDPQLPTRISPVARNHPAHAARDNDTVALQLMLQAGFPIDGRSQHGATALHWSAWHGKADRVQAILKRNPPLEEKNNDFESTPLGWAIHGSENGWDQKSGDYPKTVEVLCAAGAKVPEKISGTPAVREVLQRFVEQQRNG